MNPPESKALLSLALKAAVEGGRIASEQGAPTSIRQKSTPRDLVTATDQKVQRLVERLLAPSGLKILAEEFGGESQFPIPHTELLWVVDPIDGTVNFASGYHLLYIDWLVNIARVQTGYNLCTCLE